MILFILLLLMVISTRHRDFLPNLFFLEIKDVFRVRVRCHKEFFCLLPEDTAHISLHKESSYVVEEEKTAKCNGKWGEIQR